MAEVELVRNVFEEDKAKHHLLILGGVHVAAQDAGYVPNLLLEADVCRICLSHCAFSKKSLSLAFILALFLFRGWFGVRQGLDDVAQIAM